jgi:hypothetical protein
VCVYDLFFVIYHVLTNFMKFVTYLFDLIAYCNLALFMMNLTFNPTCADNGSVNEYVYVSMYYKVIIIIVCKGAGLWVWQVRVKVIFHFAFLIAL